MGFSRFEFGIGIGDPVPVLKMAYNVSMDECQDIMERHKLVAPHGVWLIHPSLQDTPNLAAAERIGDCGLFLVTRTVVDFRLWRAFYDYSRFVMRLGHFDAWLDSDVRTAAVGSSSEAECSGSTSRVCIFWSEFDLDEQEFSCRPNHEASNVITPTKLLLALENNDVAYPPPNPPPPEPPSAPPHPSPPPGELRCELSAIATTQGRKVPGATRGAGDAAVQQAGEMYELVDQKCWRWDPANNWPPFVAHRDLYDENPRCGDARSRDIQWGGGFSQSLMPKDTYDPNEQNNNDCALVDMNSRADDADRIDRHELVYTIEAGSNCFDKTGIKRDQPLLCDIGTNARSCGVHQNLVVFGFVSNYGIVPTGHSELQCVNRVNGMTESTNHQYKCNDGGPGSFGAPNRDDEDSTFQCYYGTDPLCGRRRFAFLAEEAGPDVPDDSCMDTMHNPPRYGANNGRCTRLQEMNPCAHEPCAPVCNQARSAFSLLRRRGRAHVELLPAWRQPVPAEHGRAPRIRTSLNARAAQSALCSQHQVSDCGWRMPKRMARMTVARSDTCATSCESTNDCGSGCDDYTDEIAMRTPPTGYRITAFQNISTCGRGTQARRCELHAQEEVTAEWMRQVDAYQADRDSKASTDQFATPIEGPGGSAYKDHRYHERTVYVNAATIGQKTCTAPPNVMTALPHFDFAIWKAASFFESSEYTGTDSWYQLFGTTDIPAHVCSDGGEGSVRVPLQVPEQSYWNYHKQESLYHYDYICPYGSQVLAKCTLNHHA
jgi:hypothetical protein